MIKEIAFITGNENKFLQFSQIISNRLPEIIFKRIDVDLPEIQGTINDVAFAKCKAALKIVDGPFFIEDTSLCMNAFGGDLPGPYIKWFLESLGTEGLCKMVHGFEDRSARAICTIVYCDGIDVNNFEVFQGITNGSIRKNPSIQGNKGKSFGWDSIFIPYPMEETYSEMTVELKNSLSHRSKAVNLFINHFK